ncbi:FG-GAP repeat domain-containing protein [Ruegeria arenilitoris]|uniref:FG-GAP repeat domain-containing protein n=1 Tax=Ruegeria arenilitoris TaxID=1173585 RepID=UPI003F5BA8F0
MRCGFKAPRPAVRIWPCRVRGALMVVCLWLAGPALAAETIATARYTDPTTRYPHGVLGDQIEWGSIELTLSDGKRRSFTLPDHLVFEDLAPRVIDVTGDGLPEVIAVESDARQGARLALYGPQGRMAATPHIGTRFRWLAPVGAADLNGDGIIEIAYVDRPHLAKTLRIWRFSDGRLTEIAALPGLTNHRIGEDFISGGLRTCNGQPELIVASADWRRIIAVRYDGGWQTQDLGPLKNRQALMGALNC